ncbi:MAG: D-cysteine desulfhydrase family protein [Anaerolineales bacterium]|nr:D-cysteine desulfhydrase family protein [Anaerolineales bacterium]
MPESFDVPKINLAFLPTPLEALPTLSKVLGGPKLWIKRDDHTGLALGGNKVRKLEFLLADAREKEAELLVTRGAHQSNHCRQTAAAAAKSGFGCKLVLTGERPKDVTGNLLLDWLFGAETVWSGARDPEEVLAETFETADLQGLKPYLIPYGGSNKLGVYAYAKAMEELQLQDSSFDRIVFASSSGGTQAGLILGGYLSGFEGEILGISVDEKASDLQARIANLVNSTAQWLGVEYSIEPEMVRVEDGYLGEGYAKVSNLEREAIRDFAQHEGILLDPVYTGRAAGGLMSLIRRGEIQGDERVLFLHTGGTPAIFVYGEGLIVRSA